MKNINKLINSKLKEISGLKCFPIIMEYDTKLPAVVFKSKITNQYVKGVYVNSSATIEINVIGEDYPTNQTIIESIDSKLSTLNGDVLNFKINKLELDNYDEFYENAYVNKLTYSVIYQ